MARSVRRVSSAAAATLPVAVMLSGCVSTQTIAARTRLVNARVVAATQPTRVARANPEIRVATPVVIHGRTGTAVVVSLSNESARALSDLPISVGITTRSGAKQYLNQSRGLDYFDTHLAIIGARASTTWVFTTARRLSGGRPFATVGFASVRPPLAAGLPRIAVATHGTARVSVTNRSGVPQEDLPIYAVAVRGGRDVAAGRVTVAHLGGHGTVNSRVTLLGSDRGATLRLIATPTIFS